MIVSRNPVPYKQLVAGCGGNTEAELYPASLCVLLSMAIDFHNRIRYATNNGEESNISITELMDTQFVAAFETLGKHESVNQIF